MGKTYKTQHDIDHFDDFFDEDYEADPDFDDDMNRYLERHVSGPLKRGKRSRDRRKSPLDNSDLEQYRLPRDWQDFDYGSDSQLHEDW